VSEGTDPTVSAGAVVGLVFAIFFAVGVVFLCVVLLRLAQVLKETKELVAGISEKTTPLLGEITNTVVTTNEQLGKVDVITDNVSNISTNASALASTFSATVGGPMIKAAAFSYGVRSAISTRRRADVEKRVKSELRAERKAKKNKEG
jgi:predicted PurR-regulated permease PerM